MPTVTLIFERTRRERAELTLEVAVDVAARLIETQRRNHPPAEDTTLDLWARYTIAPTIPASAWRPTAVETTLGYANVEWRVK